MQPDADGAPLSVGLYNLWEMTDQERPAQTTIHTVDGVEASGDAAFELKGIDGPPPEDHGFVEEGAPYTLSLYVGVAWRDANENGEPDFESCEPPIVASIEEGSFTYVAYVEPTDFFAALYLQQIGFVPGWGMYQDSGDGGPPVRIDWSAGLTLAPYGDT